VHKTKKKTSEEEQKGLALLATARHSRSTCSHELLPVLTLLHRMGKATNKIAT
jgi:hypothetical protein